MISSVTARRMATVLVVIVLAATAGLCLLFVPALLRQSSAGNAPPPLPPELERVRVALEKYQDPIAAVHDGYLSTVGCTQFISGGPDRVPYGGAGGTGGAFPQSFADRSGCRSASSPGPAL
jgi:hypothetical protein